LPPIEKKGKRNDRDQNDQTTDEYSEQDAIMDAEELHTAIEGKLIVCELLKEKSNVIPVFQGNL